MQITRNGTENSLQRSTLRPFALWRQDRERNASRIGGKPARRMDGTRTTTLGTKGPEVGVVGLGCMGMTYAYDMKTPRDDATSIVVIHRALDLGMTLIDTADRCAPTLRSSLGCGRSPSGSGQPPRRRRWHGSWPEAGTWCPSRGPGRRTT